MEKVPLLECPKCQHENEVGTKFCQGCGAKIRWLYPERTCSHCGNVWNPRKPNPKTCPACGYLLARDNRVDIIVPEVQDLAAVGFVTGTCTTCGKGTRFIAQYYDGRETKHQKRTRCLICIMKEWIELMKGETDLIPGTFDTSRMTLEEIERTLGETTH